MVGSHGLYIGIVETKPRAVGWEMLATEFGRMFSLQVHVQHPWVSSSAKTRVRCRYVEV